jgi:ADP-heptose:LPS heptosyltransferase
MVLEAIAMVRAIAPEAAIDLVVGSWNRSLAGLIPGVQVETLDVPWMARERSGLPWTQLVQRARAWRRKAYDLAINFEPDIRSNLLMALSGARRRVGFVSGGGGAVLTDAISPDPHAHIAENAKALVARAFARAAATAGTRSLPSRLQIPEEVRRKAAEARRHAQTRRSPRGHPARRRPPHQGMGPCPLRGSGRRACARARCLGCAHRIDGGQSGRRRRAGGMAQ